MKKNSIQLIPNVITYPICDYSVEYLMFWNVVCCDESHQSWVPVMEIEHGVEEMGDHCGAVANGILAGMKLGSRMAQRYQYPIVPKHESMAQFKICF